MAFKARLIAGVFILMAFMGASASSASESASTTDPSSPTSCIQPTSSNAGPYRIPLSVKKSGGGRQFTVNVCIGNQGPFPFVVDTGAEGTAIVPSLVKRLNLPAVGANQQTSGAGCSATASQRRLGSWSLGEVELDSEVVISQRIVGLGGPGEPMGLLGADVLSRFGTVRFNFKSSQLVVPGPEGPVPTKTTQFQGPNKTAVPGSLVSSSAHVVPLAVQVGPGFASAVTSVTIGSNTGSFLIDTGSTDTVVTPKFARSAKLKASGKFRTESSACGTFKSRTYKTGSWLVGNVPLARGAIDSSSLPPGLDGVFGADQMSRFSYVVLSFRSGELLVGTYR